MSLSLAKTTLKFSVKAKLRPSMVTEVPPTMLPREGTTSSAWGGTRGPTENTTIPGLEGWLNVTSDG